MICSDSQTIRCVHRDAVLAVLNEVDGLIIYHLLRLEEFCRFCLDNVLVSSLIDAQLIYVREPSIFRDVCEVIILARVSMKTRMY